MAVSLDTTLAPDPELISTFPAAIPARVVPTSARVRSPELVASTFPASVAYCASWLATLALTCATPAWYLYIFDWACPWNRLPITPITPPSAVLPTPIAAVGPAAIAMLLGPYRKWSSTTDHWPELPT